MKIKVLQVVGSLRIGGAETVAMNIYRYIDRNKFEFHYLVYGDDVGAYESEVEKLGGKVIHLDKAFIRDFHHYKEEIKRIMQKEGPYEIIHTHMMFHNALVLKAAYCVGIPIRVSHAHSTNDGAEDSGLLHKVIRFFYRSCSKVIIHKYATNFLACGEKSGYCLYGKVFFRKKGLKINNGIDLKKYAYDHSTHYRLRKMMGVGEKKVFLCVGHLEKVKNHIFLLKALSEIVSKNYIMYFLGEGKLRNSLEEFVQKNNLENNVRFMGNVNNVNEYMILADCLFMPSLFEGVPVTLLEAQAASLKCVVSDKVDEEVKITENVKFLPLSIDIWKNEINSMCCKDFENEHRVVNSLKCKDYGVEENIKKIELLYENELVKKR